MENDYRTPFADRCCSEPHYPEKPEQQLMDNYPSMPVTNGCQKRHTTGQNGAFR
jgi:hypothetical protein